MLEIKNLTVSLGAKKLLADININVADGARHLIRGANGSGKTTLVNAIAGAPGYVTDSGEIIFDEKNITNLPTDERARLGLFIGAQHVPEIPGLSVMSFLKHSAIAHNPKLTAGDLLTRISDARAKLSIPESWMARAINVGFSGGEKKRLMFLHLLILQPKMAILDEPDSGADTGAQEMFAGVINEMRGTTFLIISHQEKFTNLIKPTEITTLSAGKILI